MGKGEETRNRILDEAATLFNRKGYAGTTVSDLMEATGLQKGGIYRHFESKEELAIEAFDRAVGRVSRRIGAATQGRPPLQRLHAMVGAFAEHVGDPPVEGGCPVMNTAIEHDDLESPLRDRAERVMKLWRRVIVEAVEEGLEREEIRPEVEPETVATVIIGTLEGGLMLAKLFGDPAHMERATAHLDRYLEEEIRV